MTATLNDAGVTGHARVIDLVTPAATAPTPRRRLRPARVVVAALLAGVLAGCAGAWLLTYRSGVAWRERASAEQQRADLVTARLRAAEMALERSRAEVVKLGGELAAAGRELSQTQDRLLASEADAARLEDRLGALATEKALVEDTLAVAEQEQQAWSAAARSAGEQLAACVSELSSWLAQLPSEQAGPAALGSWSRQGDAVGRRCDQAQAASASLRRMLGG